MEFTISPSLFARIMAYTNGVSTEIGGFGLFSPKEKAITEIFPLLPQTVHGAEFHVDDEEMIKLASTPKGAQTNFWWHSHVWMGTSPSSVDTTFIERYGSQGDMLLTLIVNKKREYHLRFDMFRPIELTIDNIKLSSEYHLPEATMRSIGREIKQNVRERPRFVPLKPISPEIYQKIPPKSYAKNNYPPNYSQDGRLLPPYDAYEPSSYDSPLWDEAWDEEPTNGDIPKDPMQRDFFEEQLELTEEERKNFFYRQIEKLFPDRKEKK